MGTVSATLKVYKDYVKDLRPGLPAVAEEIAGFHGVGQVLDWMKQRSLNVIDLVGQDEFEYDFMIQLEPKGRWLVFGVT